MKDRFDVIREWAKPIEVKTEVTDDFEQVDGEIYYCFIRLYQTAYKSIFSIGGMVKEVNKIVTKEALNGKKYTHSAINYQLNDNFIGLNIRAGENNDIKIESLRTMANEEDSFQDKSNSKFDMYYIKLTKKEYDSLKKTLSGIKLDNNFKYDYLRLLTIAGENIVNKIKRFLFSKEDSNSVLLEDIQLVCSTFVSYILNKVSSRFEKYFNKTKTSIKSYTPNDLTYLPTMTYMYGGYWKEYASKTREYLKDHPEFDKYMK